MPVSTRSARVFESDVMLPLMRSSKVRAYRAGFSQVKEQLTYALSRPSRLETETHVFVPMTSLPKPMVSLLPSLEKNRTPVRVVALNTGAAFDRGLFQIVRVSKLFCVLEKTWSGKAVVPEPKVVEVVAAEPEERAEEEKTQDADDAEDACFFPEPPKETMKRTTQVFARPSFTPSFPRAIRTVFSGVEYRSRLESRFAMLLAGLGIRYVYEPMKYNNTKGRSTYTIDFFLPAQQLYVELKPKRPHIEEEMKCEEMSKSGFRVTLMYGSSVFKLPFRSEFFNGRSHRDYAHHDALRGMTWIDGVKLAGDTVFVHGQCGSTLDAPGIHLNQVVSAGTDSRWSHESVTSVFKSLQRQSVHSP